MNMNNINEDLKNKTISLFVWIFFTIFLFGIGNGIFETVFNYIVFGLFGTTSYLLWLVYTWKIYSRFKDMEFYGYSILPIIFSSMLVFHLVGTNVSNPENIFEYSITGYIIKNISGGYIGSKITSFSITIFGFSGVFILCLALIVIDIIYIKTFITTKNKSIQSQNTLSKSKKLSTQKPQVKIDPSNNSKPTLKKTSDSSFYENKNGRSESINILENILKQFGIDATVKNETIGNCITRYDLELKPGTKLSKLMVLSDDIALALAANGKVRISHVQGTNRVGIEVPNKNKIPVLFKDLVKDNNFINNNDGLLMALGKDIVGNNVYCNLIEMPHLLIAGSTGSGKSVMMNSIICSLVSKYTPEELKFWMIDPKMVELQIYNESPYMLENVATNSEKSIKILEKTIIEMTKRYKIFAELNTKDLDKYNEKSKNKLERIVVIIDELSDLMMTSGKKVEDLICRIAQMGRASGIHLIIATQRPSVDVISGLIKTNIPSRIGLTVSSNTDSRVILDSSGAEKLLGNGDCLYKPINVSEPIRVQGGYIEDKEIEKIVENCNKKYSDIFLLDEIIKYGNEKGSISTNDIQKQFKIGYDKASNFMKQLENRNLIGKQVGNKRRDFLK